MIYESLCHVLLTVNNTGVRYYEGRIIPIIQVCWLYRIVIIHIYKTCCIWWKASKTADIVQKHGVTLCSGLLCQAAYSAIVSHYVLILFLVGDFTVDWEIFARRYVCFIPTIELLIDWLNITIRFVALTEIRPRGHTQNSMLTICFNQYLLLHIWPCSHWHNYST